MPPAHSSPAPGQERPALDHTEQLLSLFVRRHVAMALALPLLACGDAATRTQADWVEPFVPEEFQAVQCEPGVNYGWLQLQGDTLAPELDSLQVLMVARRSDVVTSVAMASWGEPCVASMDHAACEAEQQRLFDTPCADAECPLRATLLATKGDQVILARDRAQVAALLGRTDSSGEAWLWLFLAEGLVPSCGNASGHAQRAVRDGYELRIARRDSSCATSSYSERVVHIDSTGVVSTISHTSEAVPREPCSVPGRRPEGLLVEAPTPTPTQRTSDSSLGELFAEMAYFEAASVFAFEVLAAELAVLGAPEALRAGVQRARRDELDHTARMSRLARRFGRVARPVQVRAMPLRDAFALACENAVEGCAREAFAAFVATFQAARAGDAQIKAELTVIAEDETRHAALAFALAAWLQPQLSREQQRHVLTLQRRELLKLHAELVEPSALQVAMVGLPTQREARWLLAALTQWIAAA